MKRKNIASILILFLCVCFIPSNSFAQGFLTLPTKDGFVTTCIFECYAGHTGTDYGSPSGSIVVAAYGGTVILPTLDDNVLNDPDIALPNSYGNVIYIDHGMINGRHVVTLYAHLLGGSFLVKVDDRVERGQPIAKSGNSGTSTGPHLHFEVRVDTVAVDPYNPSDYMWVINPPSHAVYNPTPPTYPTFNPSTANIYQWDANTLAVVDQDRIVHGVLDTPAFLTYLQQYTCNTYLTVSDFTPFTQNGVNITNTSGGNMPYQTMIDKAYLQSAGLIESAPGVLNSIVYIPLRGYYYRSSIALWIAEQTAALDTMSFVSRAYAEAEVAIAKIAMNIQPQDIPNCSNEAPKITLLGANPFTLVKGDVYVEIGFNGYDLEEGDITNQVIVSGDSVNTAISGTYVRKYDVVDSQGANAIQMLRIIHVKEPALYHMNTPFISISDINGNGWREIVTFRIHPTTKKPQLIVMDIYTGNIINKIDF